MENWKIYRTRYLAKARRLDHPCILADACGRLQHGEPGDYLVETSDGSYRVAPAHVFEDIYVEFEAASDYLLARSTGSSAIQQNALARPLPGRAVE